MSLTLNKTKAFTLIELLVVVAIIGILAAVGVVAYNGYTGAAKRNATISNHTNVVKFLEMNLMKCKMGEASIGEALTVNSQGSKKTLNCPIAANVDTKFWIGHFKYEKWNNTYNSNTEAVKANCNNDIGCIQFRALDSETFEIITYYTENNNTVSKKSIVSVN
jgi:type IV pilus assembly protein PilA